MTGQVGVTHIRRPLYTPAQKSRRDATVWTLVQGILAPVQSLVFLISLGLVFRFLATGDGYGIATLSIVVKTGFLYLIMVTGAVWEKVDYVRDTDLSFASILPAFRSR